MKPEPAERSVTDDALLAIAYSDAHVEVWRPVGGNEPVLAVLRAAGALFTAAERERSALVDDNGGPR